MGGKWNISRCSVLSQSNSIVRYENSITLLQKFNKNSGKNHDRTCNSTDVVGMSQQHMTEQLHELAVNDEDGNHIHAVTRCYLESSKPRWAERTCCDCVDHRDSNRDEAVTIFFQTSLEIYSEGKSTYTWYSASASWIGTTEVLTYGTYSQGISQTPQGKAILIIY